MPEGSRYADEEYGDEDEGKQDDDDRIHKNDTESSRLFPFPPYSAPELSSKSCRKKLLLSLPLALPYLLVMFNTALLLVGYLVIWRIARPPPTNLHEEALTDDGKSFPSGQLTWSQTFTPLPCGKSPAEAIARGCRFDIIATAWLPPKCIDYELAAEFVDSFSWQYFANRNGTDQYPDDPDTLGLQTGLIWTTHRWHSAHCAYMWKKLNRALVLGRPTDGETIKLGHTDHCSKHMINQHELDFIGSLMEIIYPPC